MAKMSKEEQARREGMAYALKIAREKGIDGLAEELRMRNILQMPIGIRREDVRKADYQLTQFILLETLVTLRDEFDFGKKRAKQFRDRFESKCELIVDDWTSWAEQAEICMEELDMTFEKGFLERCRAMSEGVDLK